MKIGTSVAVVVVVVGVVVVVVVVGVVVTVEVTIIVVVVVVLVVVAVVVAVVVFAGRMVLVVDVVTILDVFVGSVVGVVVGVAVVEVIVVETFNTGTTVGIIVVVSKVRLSSFLFLFVSELLLFGSLVISSFSCSKRNSVPLILIVNGSEVRVILFCDEFTCGSIFVEILCGTFEIVVDVLGEGLGDALEGATVVEVDFGGEVDFVRAFISWRIFSYNLRHFSTLRTP